MSITLAEKVDPKHTALIVVDVQNDFCHREGACAKGGRDMTLVEEMIPTLLDFIERTREAGVPIIFARAHASEWTDSPSTKQQRKSWATACPEDRPFMICEPGSWGADFYQVKPTENDCIVTKHRASAFFGTDLDLILRSRGITSVLMTGVATNVCVETTARHASMLDYNVVFVDDCCAARTVARHQATLENIREHFGTVVKAAELLDAWKARLA